jgi:lipoprotein-releasing system ATP-binding protein
MEILKVEKATKTYHMDGENVRALSGVNFTLDAGDITVILGPSGSGKSTLLTLLGGLSRPSFGKVYCKGQSLYDMPGRQLADFRNKMFGFVFQFHYLMPELTALENVILPGQVARREYSVCQARAEALLRHVGLKDRMDHKPGEMSGGEQQRVAVCRALMNEPEIILADEPTGNLDSKTADGIHTVLWDLCNKEGRTLIVVTHHEPLAKQADHILMLNAGQVTKKRSGSSSEEGDKNRHKTPDPEMGGDIPSEIPLGPASRWKRLFGFLIDFLFAIPSVILSWLVAHFLGFKTVEMNLPIFVWLFLIYVTVIVVFVNFALLTVKGQTIGKLLIGTRILKRKTEEKGGFLTNIIFRNVWGLAAIIIQFLLVLFGKDIFGGLIGLYFFVFDILFIFFPGSRCLHDRIAGTKVVDALN